MVKTLRNVAHTLLLFSVLSISTHVLLQTVVCTSGNCVASVVFGVPAAELPQLSQGETSLSTPVALQDHPSFLASAFQVIHGISAYVLTVAVLLLLALEAFELYYLKRLFQRKAT